MQIEKGLLNDHLRASKVRIPIIYNFLVIDPRNLSFLLKNNTYECQNSVFVICVEAIIY